MGPRECWISAPFPPPVPLRETLSAAGLHPGKAQVSRGFAEEAVDLEGGNERPESLSDGTFSLDLLTGPIWYASCKALIER
jgi:hypothetical protein